MKIEFTIGDPSNDGHGICDTFMVESNYSLKNLKAAYRLSCEQFGVDPINNLCSDYGENKLSEDTKKLFEDNGYVFKKGFDFDEDDDYPQLYVYSEGWFDLNMWFIKQSAPDLIITIINNDLPTFDLGGYGLYEG